MGYWDVEKNCDDYVEMCADYEGQFLLDAFAKFVKPNAHVLEIGMGPGRDFDVLSKTYDMVGSDASEVWIQRYKENNTFGEPDLVVLDAVTLEIDDTFDAIFSNKVLHHLYEDEMTKSLARQADLLKPGGIAFHTFWQGSGQDEAMGMLFTYYTEETVQEAVPDGLEVVDLWLYGESEQDDSLVLVLKRTA